MADTIKCPNCSANLIFDADLQKLTCDYCGASFLPTDPAITDQSLARFSEDKVTGTDSVIANKNVLRSGIDLGEEATAAEEAYDRGMADEPETEYDDIENAQELICNSCGAVVVADRNTSASYCAFCGSPALVSQRLSSSFRPKYIIPFTYGRNVAEQKFLNWCKGGRKTPFGFTSAKNISKMIGLYVPFWLFDIDGEMNMGATGTVRHVVTTGSKTVTTTEYFDVTRQGKYSWKKIPLDAETRIDDDLMEAVEPYDYSELIPYNPAYLPGFFADRFDRNADDLKARIRKRAEEYMDEEFKKSTDKYTEVRIKERHNTFTDPTADYALMPVWFLHYKYLGKDYEFAMNGQTGEVAGIVPVSRLKKILFFFLVLGATAVIMRLIVGLILGGMVG